MALLLRRYLKRRNAGRAEQWECRIGIATGPVIGSIVGIQKYVYDIFGPAVNLASRMEAICGPMEILMSEEMHDLIRDSFEVGDRGEHDIRGFGLRRIFELSGSAAELDALPF